MVGSCYQA